MYKLTENNKFMLKTSPLERFPTKFCKNFLDITKVGCSIYDSRRFVICYVWTLTVIHIHLRKNESLYSSSGRMNAK